MTQPVLELDKITVSYAGVSALSSVSLSVGAGEAVALLGPNGAGKTTTLRAVSGLVPLQSGDVRFAGESISALTPPHRARLRIAHAPEGRRVFSRMTVGENLEMGAYLRHTEGAAERAFVHELFPVLAQRSQQLAGSLSGGEQQMLAIGRALMGAPRMLLLDEPSMGLAPIAAAEVYRALAAIRDAGTTILLVEQNSTLALGLCNRGCVLEGGRITAEGTAVALREDPRVRAAYLGEGAA